MESVGGSGERDSSVATSGAANGQRVLYPVFDRRDDRTFERALDLADGVDAELLVLDLAGEDGPVAGGSRTAGSQRLRASVDDRRDVAVRSLAAATGDPFDAVVDVAAREDVGLAVFDEHTPNPLTALIRGDVPDRIGSRAPCDTVTVTDSPATERVASVLLPVAEGDHSRLAVAVAGALARGADAVVDLFHVSDPSDGGIPSTDGPSVPDMFDDAKRLLPDGVDVDTWHLEHGDVATAIVEQSRHYDVTVIGKPDRGRLRRFVAGSITDDVCAGADNTVLTVRRGDGPRFGFDA